ncbi:hypothetical protein [Longimicrobium sp.]|uniref:hypothetical protein n=1 Tax=Longimicrobium sp. TaxID=2029185 RepID=UPI002E30F41C|nr:hypothetical protein [Longimicrobium sp.]HEX6039667.1 hypothetical protein [Longimicrobium sp.]
MSTAYTEMPSSTTEETVRDATLARLRDGLRSFGIAHGFLDRHLCGCGNPRCAQDRVETMSLLAMLRAVATEWVAEPDPVREPLLHHRLASFARVFALLECPCGDPDCPTTHSAGMDTRAYVRLVADMWHGRAGNRVAFAHTEAEEWSANAAGVVVDIADRFARNLAVLNTLALQLSPDDAERIHSVASAAASLERSAWRAEARAMAAEAIATWLPHPEPIVEVRRVVDSALAVAYHAGWTTGDAALIERAAMDACSGILTLGVVHLSVSQALFAPFSRVVSLTDLDAAVDALLIAEERIAAE